MDLLISWRGTQYRVPCWFCPYQQEVLIHAVSSYAFLLPPGQYNYAALITAITAYYSLSPRLEAIICVLNNAQSKGQQPHGLPQITQVPQV